MYRNKLSSQNRSENTIQFFCREKTFSIFKLSASLLDNDVNRELNLKILNIEEMLDEDRDIDPIALKRWLKLMLLRILVLIAHTIALVDGFNSVSRYSILEKCSMGGRCPGDRNISTTLSTKKIRPDKIGNCNMRSPYNKFTTYMFEFELSLYVCVSFTGLAIINFLIQSVVSFRLSLYPPEQQTDACLKRIPTIWHKVRITTFNFATFPCDSLIMTSIVGMYASKRSNFGLGCWECFIDTRCRKPEHYENIIFLNSFAFHLNMILVLAIVFYKGYIVFFRSMDPEKCDCHCVIPRCITGCFVSLVTTCIIMMPPFVALSQKYYSTLKGKKGFLQRMVEDMETVGVIVWVCMGVFFFVVIPMRWFLLKRKRSSKD